MIGTGIENEDVNARAPGKELTILCEYLIIKMNVLFSMFVKSEDKKTGTLIEVPGGRKLALNRWVLHFSNLLEHQSSLLTFKH